jgi:hypothetical protein
MVGESLPRRQLEGDRPRPRRRGRNQWCGRRARAAAAAELWSSSNPAERHEVIARTDARLLLLMSWPEVSPPAAGRCTLPRPVLRRRAFTSLQARSDRFRVRANLAGPGWCSDSVGQGCLRIADVSLTMSPLTSRASPASDTVPRSRAVAPRAGGLRDDGRSVHRIPVAVTIVVAASGAWCSLAGCWTSLCSRAGSRAGGNEGQHRAVLSARGRSRMAAVAP